MSSAPKPDSAASPETSAPTILENLVAQATTAGASDIHLQKTDGTIQVSFRLDGVMTSAFELGPDVAERVFGRIKYLARLKTYQESMPQEGRIEKSAIKAPTDLRVATYPTVTGEKIVLRLFATHSAQGLGELGFPEGAVLELEAFLRRNAGLLLLTGPAGSGKTTTIYACLRHLAGLGGCHIITVEDPVEQIVPGVMQTEVNDARGLTFAEATRHLLRQDPQTLVIGEIRDDQTANLAVRAALTGHQVISTLHAGSCRGVFERLFVLCPDQHAVISTVEMVVNQRLLRRLCRGCGGAGCAACLQTGYHGRAPMVEWVRVTDPLRLELRVRGPTAIEPKETLNASARHLWQSGVTNEAEYRRVAVA